MAEVSGSLVGKVDSEEINCILGNRGVNHVEVIIKCLTESPLSAIHRSWMKLISGVGFELLSSSQNVPARTFLCKPCPEEWASPLAIYTVEFLSLIHL